MSLIKNIRFSFLFALFAIGPGSFFQNLYAQEEPEPFILPASSKDTLKKHTVIEIIDYHVEPEYPGASLLCENS
ncbi:hypothetical protein D3C87_464260 [compost metagenome]